VGSGELAGGRIPAAGGRRPSWGVPRSGSSNRRLMAAGAANDVPFGRVRTPAAGRRLPGSRGRIRKGTFPEAVGGRLDRELVCVQTIFVLRIGKPLFARPAAAAFRAVGSGRASRFPPCRRHVTMRCVNCDAVFAWVVDSSGKVRCPGCGSTFVPKARRPGGNGWPRGEAAHEGVSREAPSSTLRNGS